MLLTVHTLLFLAALMSVDPLACVGVCAAYLVIHNVNKETKGTAKKIIDEGIFQTV